MTKNLNNSSFTVLHISQSLDLGEYLFWIADMVQAIKEMDGHSIIPGAIGRSEPTLRQAGGQVIEFIHSSTPARTAKQMLSIAINHNVAGFIAYDSQSLEIAKAIKKAHNARIYYITHEKSKIKNSFFKKGEPTSLEEVARIGVPTQYLRDYYIQNYPNLSDFDIIKRGIDLDMISDNRISADRTASLAQRWSVIDSADHLVLIEQSYGEKNWENSLIELAMATSKREITGVRFIVIGDDNGSGAMEKLQNRIIKMAPLSPFQLVGHCGDIEAAIKLSSMMVFLSAKENQYFPLAILTQALGRNVILPNSPSSEEFGIEGTTSYLTSVNANINLDRILQLLSRDQAEINAQQMAAKNFVQQYYNAHQARINFQKFIRDINEPL